MILLCNLRMIESLLATDCIKQGKFILKSGEISKYYFDMKGLISYPKLMKEVGDKIYNLFIFLKRKL